MEKNWGGGLKHFAKSIQNLRLVRATQGSIPDSADQDKITQNMQSDLGLTPSDKEIFVLQN